MLTSLSQWNASRIFPHVYLGDYRDAMNKEALKQHNITHILTILLGLEPSWPHDFHYLVVRAQDHNSQDLLSYVEFLHNYTYIKKHWTQALWSDLER